MTTREIRPATVTEAATVGDVLAEAFDDYPWIRWAFGEDRRRERLNALYRLQAGLAGAELRGTWLAEEDGEVVAAGRPAAVGNDGGSPGEGGPTASW